MNFKHHVTCLGLMISALTACGYSHKENVDLSPTPQNEDANQTPLATWYGVVTKCLVDAEEVKVPLENGSYAYTIKGKLACSDIMEGKDYDEISQKVFAWEKSHCKNNIPIRNGTAGNWAGCLIKPLGGQMTYVNGTNSHSKLSQILTDPEHCGGKQGLVYGTVQCHR